MNIRKVVSIAGSDSSGGAGIQADLKTMSALGCYGMTVMTAVTAQNTVEVDHIEQISEASITAQFNVITRDITVDAFKIGMLGSVQTVQAIADCLLEYSLKQPIKIVLDPVLVATSGANLGNSEVAQAIVKYLFPISTIVTPNLPEAQTFLNREILDVAAMKLAAQDLLALGANSVLLKGGHLSTGQSVDKLADVLVEKRDGKIYTTLFEHPKIATHNTHGTGCTLSSAIACGLAQPLSLLQAVENAIDYTQGAISAAQYYPANILGHGHGPLWHAYRQFPLSQ